MIKIRYQMQYKFIKDWILSTDLKKNQRSVGMSEQLNAILTQTKSRSERL